MVKNIVPKIVPKIDPKIDPKVVPKIYLKLFQNRTPEAAYAAEALLDLSTCNHKKILGIKKVF